MNTLRLALALTIGGVTAFVLSLPLWQKVDRQLESYKAGSIPEEEVYAAWKKSQRSERTGSEGRS